MSSDLLNDLYKKYDIANLSYGKIHDKLGDVYEDFCVIILSDMENLQKVKAKEESDSLEFSIYKSILASCGIIDYSNIQCIVATKLVPHRETHGLSKTDVIINVKDIYNCEKNYALSCKQSYVAKMAFAEFSVNTICNEVGINDEQLKKLMLKHQKEKSAKLFTPEEKNELRNRIAPIKEQFVRWVITGSTEKNQMDVRFPTVIVKFKLKKPQNRYNIHIDIGELSLQSFKVSTAEDYIKSILYTKDGKTKMGGFGTGLYWTYATGSGGSKIQFKA